MYCRQEELANFPIIIVESELDAILIQQEASEFCACLALSGATKKPDFYSHQLLCKAPKILFSLDFDEAGKKSYIFWKNTYKNLKPWPAPQAKSPGDAFKVGINLRRWIKFGLINHLHTVEKVITSSGTT